LDHRPHINGGIYRPPVSYLRSREERETNRTATSGDWKTEQKSGNQREIELGEYLTAFGIKRIELTSPRVWSKKEGDVGEKKKLVSIRRRGGHPRSRQSGEGDNGSRAEKKRKSKSVKTRSPLTSKNAKREKKPSQKK